MDLKGVFNLKLLWYENIEKKTNLIKNVRKFLVKVKSRT